MKKPNSLILMVMLFVLSNCADPPSASFTHTSDSYEEGDTIYFTSTATLADQYEWTFGDGATSAGENPYHIYNETGNYDVKLKVLNADGNDEVSESITIKYPTILAFTTFDTASLEIVTNVGILLYESEEDWNNNENVAGIGFTDLNGEIEFYHAKSIVYYLTAIKEVQGGFLFFAGWLSEPVALNTKTSYGIPMVYFSQKKSENAIHQSMLKMHAREITLTLPVDHL